jgi:hypothetical protein
MLYGIRDINLLALNADLREHLVEIPPRRPDKWMALPVFDIARLLADKYHVRTRRSLAENRLRCILKQGAPLTVLRRLPQRLQIAASRQKRRRRRKRLAHEKRSWIW